jgi:flavin reductase (DIM6/NTAB) family NADH-FMN oxidoreductase RutF
MSTYRSFDPKDFELRSWHPYMIGSFFPRPIAWVSTIDAEGVRNLAPFSYFGVFSSKPPILGFSPSTSARTGGAKDTLRNVRAIPEAVVHLVPYALAHKMNITTGEFDPQVDEIALAGLETIPSERVRPPRIAGTPVQAECRVLQVLPLGENPGAGQLVLAEVLLLHIDEAVLDEQGLPDPRKMDILARLGGFWYARIRAENLFWMKQPRNPAEIITWQELPRDIRESSVLSAAEVGQLLAFRPDWIAEAATWPFPEDPVSLHTQMKALLPQDAPAAWELYKKAAR